MIDYRSDIRISQDQLSDGEIALGFLDTTGNCQKWKGAVPAGRTAPENCCVG
jgi:hypothetical protein